MTRQNKLMALIAGTAIALSGNAFAGPQNATPAPAVKQATAAAPAATNMTRGVVKAMDGDKLVIRHKTKSGPKEMTLVMNSVTQREGDLKVGSPVTVHYRTSNKQHVATMVHVRTAKKSR
jgi:hypothetical protein